VNRKGSVQQARVGGDARRNCCYLGSASKPRPWSSEARLSRNGQRVKGTYLLHQRVGDSLP